MDPNVEGSGLWRDFHATFINYWREALADLAPDNYEVRIDEQVNLVEMPPERVKLIRPDLAVTQHGPAPAPPAVSSGTLTLEPVTRTLPIEEEVRTTRIEILERPQRTLVTVLELLSPTNKTSPGRSEYLAKRRALLRQGVNLVELDLLLAGQRLPTLEPLPPGHYYALICRSDQRPYCDVYPWTVRQPLPTIPVPLRKPDGDIPLDLAQVFATAYDRGRYVRSIDYAAAPAVPLGNEDLQWATERAALRKQR